MQSFDCMRPPDQLLEPAEPLMILARPPFIPFDHTMIVRTTAQPDKTNDSLPAD